MTSRERVLLAIDGKRTDRIPTDYHSHDSVTLALIDKLGVTDQEELLRALGIDMRRVQFNHRLPDVGPDSDGYMRNLWGLRYRSDDPDQGRYTGIWPFDENTTVDDVDNHEWPDASELDYSQVKPQCEKYGGQFATFGAPWSPFFHEVAWTIGQENFFVWMTTKPDVVQALIDRVVDFEVQATRLFLEAADGMVDIAYFGNDFGTQRGLFVSPQMYDRFLRRPLKRFFDVAKEFGCRVMKHSCGAVRSIIPWFIEDGVDILDPVQTAAAGMGLGGLLSDFGDRLCFHGAMDTQFVLPQSTTGEVRAKVNDHRQLSRDRGRYILCGSQEYMDDIPLDNLLAMYDENRKIG